MAYNEEIIGTVQDQFELAGSYADTAWSEAMLYLDALSSLVASYKPDFIDLSYDIEPIQVGTYNPVKPAEPDLTITLPVSPLLNNLDEVSIDSVDVPSLSVLPPVVTFPAEPIVTWPESPGEAPVTGEIEYPTKPSYTLPTIPTLDELTFPNPPNITLPDFEGEEPFVDVVPPGSLFVYNEGDYVSDVKDAVDDKLLSDIQNGGTGLNEDVEEAIWQRALAREEIKKERIYDEAEDYFASRGWSIPPGALAGRLQEALSEMERADSQVNYEIMIEQAKLAQQNTQFALTLAVEHEKVKVGYVNAVADRAYNAAKFTQEAAVLVFNATVTKYNLDLDKYKTMASVYESRMKGALIEIERYKSLLEGVSLEASVQKQLIDIYVAQLGAIDIISKLYSVEMEAARIKADVQRLIIEGYRSKVDAYTSNIGGITARYNAYQAQLAGEESKVRVYTEQVKAYDVEMRGVQTEAQINIAEVGITLEKNKLLIEQYKSELVEYNAKVQASIGELDVIGKSYGYQIGAYNADVDFASKKIDADIESYKAQSEQVTNRVSIMLKEGQVNLDAAMQQHGIQVETAKAGANIISQMVASSLASVSAAAQMSYRYDYNRSDSESSGTSTRTVHQYNYSP